MTDNSLSPAPHGLEAGVPMEVYQSWEGISAHDLMLLSRSYAHYREAKLNPKEPTPAMRFGSAAHTWILEPEIAPDQIVVAPTVDRRTKAGKEAWADFQAMSNGRTIISEEEAHHLSKMASAVASSTAAMDALGAAPWREHSCRFKRHGVAGRCRPDAAGHGIIVDLKTTQDASPAEFRRTAATFRYHWQAAWYIDSLNPILGSNPFVCEFVFVVVERQPPYSVGVYTLDDQALDAARQGIESALEVYRVGEESPGYASADACQELSLPRWAIDRDNA
jgi:exodeoxyribonuclease VIII